MFFHPCSESNIRQEFELISKSWIRRIRENILNKCLLNIVSNEKSTWVENLEEDSFRFEGSFFSLDTKHDRECILCYKLYYPKAEMDGHKFGQESASDTESRTPDFGHRTRTRTRKNMSENLGYGQTSGTRVHMSTINGRHRYLNINTIISKIFMFIRIELFYQYLFVGQIRQFLCHFLRVPSWLFFYDDFHKLTCTPRSYSNLNFLLRQVLTKDAIWLADGAI